MHPSDDEQQAAFAHGLASELQALVGKLKRRLRAQAHLGDFTWTQMRVLLRLEREGPATASALARAEGVRPQSMGETVSVLKSAGLVCGAPDPDDGRQTVLSLTPTCRESLTANRAAREDWLFQAIQTRLSDAEQASLGQALVLLQRLADD